MKILEPIAPVQSLLVVKDQEFIFQTNYNHLCSNKKFYTLTHKASGRYFGRVMGKAHAKTIAKLFLTGDEPLSIYETINFLKTTYEGKADFEQAMSGSTYMRIGGKTVRISDHDGSGLRGTTDLDLPVGLSRKMIIKEIDNLAK